MVQRHDGSSAAQHIDVPDRGPVEERLAVPIGSAAAAPLQATYAACPLCGGTSTTLGFANCTSHSLWHARLPASIEWVRCAACAHVHTRHYWTGAGKAEVLRQAANEPAGNFSAILPEERAKWASVVDRVVRLRGGYTTVAGQDSRPVWVDAGCGTGTLVMTASDYGFAAVGLDIRAARTARIQELGFTALHSDYMELRIEVTLDVLSMMEVLEQIAEPRAALEKAAQVLRPGGLLIVSTADVNSSGWKVMDVENTNPYWTDPARHHNFSRERVLGLLNQCGFQIVDFTLANRGGALMEIYALRQ